MLAVADGFFSGFGGGEQFLLVAALHDVDDDEHADDEVEGGLAHLFDRVTSEIEVGEMATLRTAA